MRALCMVVVAVALVAAACGDSDEGGSTAGDQWCDVVDELTGIDPFSSFDGTTAPTADELADAFDETAEVLARVRGQVPSEIRADIELTADTFDGVIELLEEADFDFASVDPSDERLGQLSSEALQAAGDRIEAYNNERCGLVSDADDGIDDTVPNVPAEVPLDALGQEIVDGLVASGFSRQEARCLLDQLGPTMSGFQGSNPADALRACGVELDRLGELGG